MSIFAALHERSAALGQPVQAITGIPYFYRQFGYEYALDLEGGRVAFPASIPAAPSGEPEPYALRDATSADIPFIGALYASGVPVGQMEEVARNVDWRHLARLFDPTLPTSGLIDGRKVARFMAELLPVHTFEGVDLNGDGLLDKLIAMMSPVAPPRPTEKEKPRAGEARAAIDLARATFGRYSFDLIYARPGQTTAAWRAVTICFTICRSRAVVA